MFKLTEKLALEARLFLPPLVPFKPKNVYLNVSSKDPVCAWGGPPNSVTRNLKKPKTQTPCP